MDTQTASCRTTRELRTAGAVAAFGGIVLGLLPGAAEGCWVSARLTPAILLVAFGALITGLGSRRFELDRQVDEIVDLRTQVAARHHVPVLAVADRDGASGRGAWAKLPFFGLFLGVLAMASAASNIAAAIVGCSEPTSGQWGAATGFAASGLVTAAVGLRRYRRRVAENAVLIHGLRTHPSTEDSPGED